MLTRDALVSALPLTQALDSAGVFLQPVENTPLAALVNATRSDDNFVKTENDGSFDPDVESIEYIANVQMPEFQCSPHDKVMDEILDVAVKAVQGHINFAKTVVNPAVQELAEKTQMSLNNMAHSALNGMEVVVWAPPAPLLNPSLESSVRRFEEVAFDSPPLIMKLPLITVQEIVELMATGGSGLDADIREWAATKGETFLIEVWENIFQQKQAGLGDVVVKQFIDYMNCPVEGTDYALAVYLLARRLVDEPMEGTEMPLAAYEKTMVEFRNQAGRHLVHVIDDLDRAIKNGILVRGSSERSVEVFGPVYKEWIEAGGENEVLFGNLLEQPVAVTVEQINDKATTLLAKWNRHAALTAMVENNRRFENAKYFLEKHFREQLLAITEGDESLAANRETILRLFEEQLGMVRESELENLYDLCLRLVCRSRFARTDAERILSGIERISRENPSISVREAAAVSMIEYVAFWVASQFRASVR